MALLTLLRRRILAPRVLGATAALEELRLCGAEARDRLVAAHERALQGVEVDLLVVGDVGLAAVVHTLTLRRPSYTVVTG